MIEHIRYALLHVALAGYFLILARLWATRLWLRYPFFGLMLLADSRSMAIGYNDAVWIPRIEYTETALKLLVFWEAFRRVTEHVWPTLRSHMWMALMATVIVGAVLTLGIYGPGDYLPDIKAFRMYVHTGMSLAGWALVTFFVFYDAVEIDRRDAWHGILLIVWWTAVTASELTKPGPGELVKWQWANIGYRVIVIACLYRWFRIYGSSRPGPLIGGS